VAGQPTVPKDSMFQKIEIAVEKKISMMSELRKIYSSKQGGWPAGPLRGTRLVHKCKQ